MVSGNLILYEQAHYGIHGSLGGRLFDLITQNRKDHCLYYEDIVIAKVLTGYLFPSPISSSLSKAHHFNCNKVLLEGSRGGEA